MVNTREALLWTLLFWTGVVLSTADIQRVSAPKAVPVKAQSSKSQGQDSNDDERFVDGDAFEGDIDNPSWEILAEEYGEKVADRAVKDGLAEPKKKGGDRRLGGARTRSRWFRRENDLLRVPFTLNGFTATEEGTIRSALSEFTKQVRVVTFAAKTDDDNDYIEFLKDSNLKGCGQSRVGRKGGKQDLKLRCVSQGTILHEVLHALGFWHEQSRDDRDTWVSIDWKNIRAGQEHNFAERDTVDFGSAYDLKSIMHYSAKAFGKTISSCSNGYINVCNRLVQIKFEGTGQDNGGTRYCVDYTHGHLGGSSTQEVVLHSCHTSGPYLRNQLWQIIQADGNDIYFKSSVNPSRCLTVDRGEGDSAASRLKFKVLPCRLTSQNTRKSSRLRDQRFQLFLGDPFEIRFETDTEYCLDRNSANPADKSSNNMNVHLWKCDVEANQRWRFDWYIEESSPFGCSSRIPFDCSRTNNKKTTIVPKFGQKIDTSNVLSLGDRSQVRAMYMCGSDRNIRDLCSPFCQCHLNEGRCKTDADCVDPLVCRRKGYHTVVCTNPDPSPTPFPVSNPVPVPTPRPVSSPSPKPGGNGVPRAPGGWSYRGLGFCRDKEDDQGRFRMACSERKGLCSFNSCISKCEAKYDCMGVEFWHNREERTGTCELHFNPISHVKSDGQVSCFSKDSRAPPAAPSSYELLDAGFCRDENMDQGDFDFFCSSCTFSECTAECDSQSRCTGVEYWYDRDRDDRTGGCELHFRKPRYTKRYYGSACYVKK